MNMHTILRQFIVTGLFAGANLILVTAAQAQPVCQVVGINPGVLVCSPTADFFRDQGVIDRRDHLDTGTYLEVPEAKRPKSWPLGSPNIQACRHCLVPDRQNVTRLKALQ